MNALRRAFVAVVPPPAVVAAVESLVESRAGSVRVPDDSLRWAPGDQWHVTLQFLGRVDDSAALVESLTESLRRVPAFDVRLGRGGAFPSPGRGSVFWLGVSEGADELGALAGTVATATARLGFAADDRPFRPHLSLARSPLARDLRALIAALGDGPAGPPWTVDQVVLVESDTRPEGALHTVRARLTLGE
jgi:2'-5' RNA ligase